VILIAARNRAVGAVGGWLALAGGVWFIAGPTVARLWDGGAGSNPIGAPIGSNSLQVFELLGYFFALGAAAVAFAAFALGRLSMVGIGDVEEGAPATTTAARSDGARGDDGERADAPPKPRRRLFRRSS
jgi:hypothetical protein